MYMRAVLFLMVLNLFACKEKSVENIISKPDITSNRCMMMTFTGNTVDQVSLKSGIIHAAKFTNDRKGNAYQALSFNANDSSYVEFTDISLASFPENIFTISFWLKMDDTTSNMAVLSKREVGGPFEYSIDNHFHKSSLTFDNWIADASGPVYGIDPLNAKAIILPGEWHHYAWVGDGNNLKTYLDGILQSGIDERNLNKFFTASTSRLILGDGGGFGRHYYLTGTIDELFIFSRALNVSEINYLKDYIISK